MAKSFYSVKKRRKELERKQKKEEKRQRKLEKGNKRSERDLNHLPEEFENQET